MMDVIFRCHLCQDWGWLVLDDDFIECPNGEALTVKRFIECPNGEEGWSSNDSRFHSVPQFSSNV